MFTIVKYGKKLLDKLFKNKYMKPLQIDGDKAKVLFPNASKEFKEMLIDSFGKEYFFEKITDRVKSIADAYIIVGRIRPDLQHFIALYGELEEAEAMQAHWDLMTLFKALNEGWRPTWSNSEEKKWYCWFNLSRGFGFSDAIYDWTDTVTCCGSRLVLKNKELALHAGGSNFLPTLEKYLTFKNKQ